MFGKLIIKLYNWHIKKVQSKYVKKYKTAEDKKKEEFVAKMQELYGFAQWLRTKGLPNRRARKHFYRELIDGKPMIENAIKSLMDLYSKDVKEKK